MTQYQMPRPQPGDLILFSTDIHHFTNPCVGWVTDERGECTVNVLAFTASGFVQKSSVHHKDDPGIVENAEWARLGAWEHKPKDSRLSVLSEKVSLLERKLEALAHGKGSKGQ